MVFNESVTEMLRWSHKHTTAQRNVLQVSDAERMRDLRRTSSVVGETRVQENVLTDRTVQRMIRVSGREILGCGFVGSF